MSDKIAGIETSEIIRGGAKQLKEAAFPTGIRKEKDTGEVKFEEARQPGEILERAELNRALTPDDVGAYLRDTRQELNVLEKIPASVKFSLEPGVEGQRKRKEQLRAILKIIGVEEVEVEGASYTVDEVWDAVCYEGRQAHNFSGKKDEATDLLGDDRGEKIKKQAKKIFTETGKVNAENILNIATTLVVEGVDPLSLREKDLRKPFKKTLFAVHGKQKISNAAKATVRDVIVVKKHLERWQVVNTFLNQQAEGRTGQEKEAKPGDPQLPYQLGFDEKRKRIVIAHVPDEEMDEIVKVLRETDHMVKTAQDQILQEVQGYRNWVAEAVIRRAHEIWSETSKSIQKDPGGMMTHLSEVGHGHFIAAALEIPEVGKILARPDWYQPRDPLTDRPKEMPSVTKVVKNVKRWAKSQDIPSSKVDLAFFLTQLLQTGHWIGRIGLKHRNILERYGLEELATGLPIGVFDKVPQMVDGVVKNAPIEEMRRDERINFELQVRDFAETVAGTCLDWSAEHLGRLVDGALQEDILYRMNVGEPPLYAPPEEIDERIVAAIHEKQMLFEGDSGLKETKELLEESYLHREQYRWVFVPARFGGLYAGWERRLGKQSAEKQYLNPGKQEDRQALIDWLQNKNFAIDNLARAGVNPAWITDEVIVRLFTDDNMRKVNDFRELIFERENRKVQLPDLRAVIEQLVREEKAGTPTPEDATSDLAMVLEFVLRDKRTWNVDMGINNSRFSDPSLDLAREVREKSEFGANEAHILVTMEDSRQNIHDTFRKILGNMSLIHLENEFPNIKKYMEEMINAYGDDPRYRSGTLTGPELAIETSLSIRAAEMITGYYLAGYEGTGGDWVASQQHLYDRLDINRILHEHFHPVVGMARRIYEIQKHEKWIDEILARQRAVPSNAVDTRKEIEWRRTSNLGEILLLEEIGGKGFGMYSHCVREIGEYGQDIGNGIKGLHLDNDKRYWEIRYERMAQKFYEPGSEMALVSWKSDAEKGQTNREKARGEIDKYVAVGFMRRWYKGNREKVGLGDKFQMQFETYIDPRNPEKGKRMEIFPINFMVSLRQQAYGVSVEWAMAHDYSNPTAFWYEGKAGTLHGADQVLWEEFRKKMLVEWMVDAKMDDSQIPTYYWEWRKAALEMVGLNEESVEQLEDSGFYSISYAVTDKVKARVQGFDRWATQILKTERENFRDRLMTDPIPGALAEVEMAYCAFVLRDVGEVLTRAHHYRGMSMGKKAQLQENIVNHFNEGHINADTRDLLLSRLVETRYDTGLVVALKDWKDIVVNDEIPLSPLNLGIEIALSVLEVLGMKDIKKGDWYQWQKTITIPSLGGWVAGFVYSGFFTSLATDAVLRVGTNISTLTSWINKFAPFVPATSSLPLHIDTIIGGVLAAWFPATVASWGIRLFNQYVSPKLLGGKRWAPSEPNLRRKLKQKG